MTSVPDADPAAPKQRRRTALRTGVWTLQDAKARFSELVRRVSSDGPQRVAVRGLDEVVVVSAKQFRRLEDAPTGKQLIEAMQASPYRDIEIASRRCPMPVRNVDI